MDIILHPGAHRTGTTTFQSYLRGAEGALTAQGLLAWEPRRTRKGLFHGLLDPPACGCPTGRAEGRMRLATASATRQGATALIVSEENMLGTPRACLRAQALYPDAATRLARVGAALGAVRRVVLQIRSPEMWWTSTLAYLLPRGAPLPDTSTLATLAEARRSWRHVIGDIRAALPEAEIVVTPFERLVSRPDLLLRCATGQAGPALPPGGIWLHHSPRLAELRAVLAARGEDPSRLPEGEVRWMPFTPMQAAALRESYSDDLFWLRAGAGGLARLTEDPEHGEDSAAWPPAPPRRGQDDDSQTGQLAGTR